MSDRYREHRVRTSLQAHLGRSPADPDLIERLASEVYCQGRGVYFTPEQLAQMPEYSRLLIESEAARINGPRR